MKRNFDAEIKDFDGNSLRDGENALTLKVVAVNSLMAIYPDERDISGNEKLARYKIASKVHGGGMVELTAEEVAKIKALIGKAYSPAVVGPAFEILEE